MQKYEYLVIKHLLLWNTSGERIQERLQEAAEKGYRVIHVASSSNEASIQLIYTLEKEKTY